MFQLRGIDAVAVSDEDTQSDTGVPRGGWERSALILLGVAAAIGIAFPFLVSAWTGSLSIPHNDSWCFSRAAEVFARTGRVHLFNWNSMALVGLFVPLWKAGSSILVQDAYVGVLAVVALWAAFDILCAVGGRRRAAAGVLVLVCWPGFGLLSTSFMTDVPALAAVTVTLAIGRRALDRASVPLFLAASVTGFWGFTIREQAIAAIVGVYAGALWKRELLRPAKLAWLLGFGTAMAVGALAFEGWRRTVPNAEAPVVTLARFPGWHYVLFTAAGGWLYLALALSPVVVLTARPWAWSWRVRGVSLAALVWFAYEVNRGAVVLPQNYLQPNGAYSPAFLGLRPNLFPRPIWDLLLPLGCLASALLIGLVLLRVRTLRKEVLVFALVTAGSVVLELSEHWILFELPASTRRAGTGDRARSRRADRSAADRARRARRRAPGRCHRPVHGQRADLRCGHLARRAVDRRRPEGLRRPRRRRPRLDGLVLAGREEGGGPECRTRDLCEEPGIRTRSPVLRRRLKPSAAGRLDSLRDSRIPPLRLHRPPAVALCVPDG